MRDTILQTSKIRNEPASLWSRQGEDNALRWLYVLGQSREDRSVVGTGITTVDEYCCIFNNQQTEKYYSQYFYYTTDNIS